MATLCCGWQSSGLNSPPGAMLASLNLVLSSDQSGAVRLTWTLPSKLLGFREQGFSDEATDDVEESSDTVGDDGEDSSDTVDREDDEDSSIGTGDGDDCCNSDAVLTPIIDEEAVIVVDDFVCVSEYPEIDSLTLVRVVVN